MKSKKDSYRSKYTTSFFTLSEMTNKPSKVATAKSSFLEENVIEAIYFDKCFLFHVITVRHCFLKRFIVIM